MAEEAIKANDEVPNGFIQSDDSCLMTPTVDEPAIVVQLPDAADAVGADNAESDYQEQAGAVASKMRKKKSAVVLVASAALLAVVVGLGAGLGTKNGNKSTSSANNAFTLEDCLKEEEALEQSKMGNSSWPTWMPTTSLPTYGTTPLDPVSEETGEEMFTASTTDAVPAGFSYDFTDTMTAVKNSNGINDGLVRRDLRGSISSSAANKVNELKAPSSKSRRLQCDELLADHASSGGVSKSSKSAKSAKGSKKSKTGKNEDNPTDRRLPTRTPTRIPTPNLTDSQQMRYTAKPSVSSTSRLTDSPTVSALPTSRLPVFSASTTSRLTNSPSRSLTATPTDSPVSTPKLSVSQTSRPTDSPSSSLTATPTDSPMSTPKLSVSQTSRPTDSPSSSLTGRPSRSPTQDCPSPTVGPPDTLPVLTSLGGVAPFNECEGDCNNSDANCVDGLVCYRRFNNGNETVPGCSGMPEDAIDYCVQDRADYLWYIEANPTVPLDRCEGNCDSNDDCQGTLECFMRGPGSGVTPEPREAQVPGCCGTGRKSTDYCYDPKDA